MYTRTVTCSISFNLQARKLPEITGLFVWKYIGVVISNGNHVDEENTCRPCNSLWANLGVRARIQVWETQKGSHNLRIEWPKIKFEDTNTLKVNPPLFSVCFPDHTHLNHSAKCPHKYALMKSISSAGLKQTYNCTRLHLMMPNMPIPICETDLQDPFKWLIELHQLCSSGQDLPVDRGLLLCWFVSLMNERASTHDKDRTLLARVGCCAPNVRRTWSRSVVSWMESSKSRIDLQATISLLMPFSPPHPAPSQKAACWHRSCESRVSAQESYVVFRFQTSVMRTFCFGSTRNSLSIALSLKISDFQNNMFQLQSQTEWQVKGTQIWIHFVPNKACMSASIRVF